MIFQITDDGNDVRGTIELDLSGEDEIRILDSDFLPQITDAIVKQHRDKILTVLYTDLKDDEHIFAAYDKQLNMPDEFFFIR